MVSDTVTVLIPSVSTRTRMLNRAMVSVFNQLRQPNQIIISIDHERLGSAGNRNRALFGVQTTWVAFLDDDDEFLPSHLLCLLQNSDDADVVYTGCKVLGPEGEEIPLKDEWGRFGKPFDAELLRKKSYLPVTCLARMDLIMSNNCFFEAPEGTDYDDWGFYLKLLDAGARFKHIPQRTWIWHHWGGNSSGRPDRW